jgi:hypothetical protein
MAFPRMRALLSAALVATVATAAAAASHADLACGPFTLAAPVVFPRQALVLDTISVDTNEVVLNGDCVSRHARVRQRAAGGIRFVAIFDECGLARGIKVRGRSDGTCGTLGGRIVVRRPHFRASFRGDAISVGECGTHGVCAADSFCELPPGVCATDLPAGACVPFPDVCPDVFAPVCGCDGATYGNDCERQAAGVSAAHDGPCDTAGCFENAECGPDAYCAKPPGQCQSAGQCRPRAILPCPLGPSPVCGCDGATYDSACAAAAVGVNVAHEGACEQRCGTIAGLSCPDGDVCDLEPGMCNGADLGGVCVPKPEVCPEIYAPVCGCDGVTYGNDCERVAAEAQKDHDGACDECVPINCPPDTLPVDTNHDGCPDDCLSARCETNADCPADRWCTNDAGGDCAAPGWCAERPQTCPDVWLPVCGCDGQTYSNDCDAAAAGVRVAHQGTCLCEPPICPDGTRPHDSNQDGCDDECVPASACFDDADCAAVGPDLYCRFEDGMCGGAGECREVPQECPTIVDPVCGCNGVTYTNDCEAAPSSVRHRGPCEPTCGICPANSVPIDTSGDGCPDFCIGPPCTTQCGGTRCTITCTASPPT